MIYKLKTNIHFSTEATDIKEKVPYDTLLPYPILSHYFLLLPELEIPAFPSSPDNYNLTSKPTFPVFQMNQFIFLSDALTGAGISVGSLVSCHVFTSWRGQGVKGPTTGSIKSIKSVECSETHLWSSHLQSLSLIPSTVHTQILHVNFGQDSAHRLMYMWISAPVLKLADRQICFFFIC